jgi:seryl-tRNA synthetase
MRGRAVLAALAVGLCGAPALAQDLGSTLQTGRQTVQETEKSQQRIDQLDGQTQSLLSDYRANLKQLEQLNRYNASQQRQVAAQQRELESLRKDIDNISGLQRSVQPLMEDMLAALERFVEADMPFLVDERRERIARLRRIMEDPERSAAQRYRLIVEAYQIENEYGRTIESYRGNVELDGSRYENAEFLRLGRMGLIVRTDDDAVLKHFDLASRAWVDLDRSFLPHVKTGLRIAREQIPPDLMIVPVTAPQAATGG